MAPAHRVALSLIAVAALACACAAGATTMQVPAGAVLSQDRHLADSNLSDDKVIYATADKLGEYRLRKVANGPWETLSRDDFLAFATSQLAGRTTITPLDYDDGWRVRYMAADGRLYVWDSKTKVTRTGDWKIGATDTTVSGQPIKVVQICTSIPAGLRLLGDLAHAKPACYPAGSDFSYPEDAVEHGRETRDGDPFGLSQGHKPETKTADVRPQWPDEVKQ